MNAPPLPYDAGAIVLAGGESRRMGTNKCMLPYAGRPLIAHVIAQLVPLFPHIRISTNTPETYGFLGLPMVPDEVPGRGPMGGIAAALADAPLPWNFVVAADIPNLPLPLIAQLYERRQHTRCVVPSTGPEQFEPLFAFYHRDLMPSMKNYLVRENFRMQDFLQGCDKKVISIPRGHLANINTPSHYAAQKR